MRFGKYVAVTYDPHALTRIAERRISQSQIERAITHPDRTYPSIEPPGRVVAEQITMTGATLRVVFAENWTARGLEAYVVTAIRIGRR